MRTQLFDQLVIKANGNSRHSTFIRAGHNSFPCIVGHGGVGRKTREGDGITPSGNWMLSYFLYRPDRIRKPCSILQGFPILPQDSWCDLQHSNTYNLPLAKILPESEEALWRLDNLYDIIVVLDHNTQPAIRGQGSAIFLHLKGPNRNYTQGCVAISQNHLLKILTRCGSQTKILIQS